jgi:hypothetical protein
MVESVSTLGGDAMISTEGEFVRLTIPLEDAVAFAMGWSDLGSTHPTAVMRRIIGELAVDALQCLEHWREAVMLRDSIERLWPCEESGPG